MGYKPYPEYKNSQVDWVGAIPKHWITVPFFMHAKEKKVPNKGMIEDNLLSLSYGNIIRKNITTSEGLLPESYETYQVVKYGDIVFRFTDLQNDKRSLRSGLVRERGIITSAYLAVKATNMNSEFLAHLMRAYDVIKVFYGLGGGLRQALRFDGIKRMPILVPPINEQLAIVDYINHETAQIDQLIEKKTRFIELLKEKRAALITEAVTGKFDVRTSKPYPEYKNSQVDWVGAIPKHWITVPFFMHAKEKKVPNKGMIEDNLLSLSYGNIIRKNITTSEGLLPESYETYQVVKYGDIVFRFTDLQNDKRSLRSGLVRERGIITSAYLAVKATNMNSEFLAHLMRAYDVIKVFYGLGGGLRQALRFDGIKRMPILVPPINEQLAIVDYINHETAQMDKLTEETQRSIDLLKEKRTALITAAVTGKIDVRDYNERNTA
ncbi:restriction endonuclease subunit S [Thiolapillus sp.]|uniref:restriction endonuclease subunit S n=1 Tax=Thiolapillus sp. TaxID=2017437 RepID=UPI0025FE2798|nr:restriction endonuclease subunit S [Thiolapillus sp.]